MKYKTLLAATVLFAAGPPLAAQPRPMTIDDVMRLRIINGVEANPAGPGAIVRIQEYDGGPRFLRDLWLVVPGAEPRRLTVGGKTGGSFAWSPDGHAVAFAGERGDKSGIFLLPLEGGEARLLVDVPVDADNLRWVGQRVYFSAEAFPDCKADLACTRARLDEKAKGPSAQVYDELFMRQWNTWRDGTFQGLFSVDVSGANPGKVEAVARGAFDVLQRPFGGVEDYSVSADGTVVYTAKKAPAPATHTNDDLYQWAGGQELQLTDGKGCDRTPAISRDGKRLAWLSQATAGFESDRWRLMVRELPRGEEFEASAGIDNWVVEFAWGGDSLFVVLAEKGRRNLYRVEAKPKAEWRKVFEGGAVKNLSIGDGGKTLIYTLESQREPPDLHAMDIATGKSSRLTRLNEEALKAVKVPRVDEVWYDVPGAGGEPARKIHAFLVRPPDATPGTKHPLVVMIHGGPQGAFEDSFFLRWNPLHFAGMGFVVAMPNVTGSNGYGQSFVNAVSRDWGGKAYRDVMALLDFAATLPDVDATRACAMGGSYGGYMVNWIEGHTDRFRCLISHAGLSSLASMYGATDELWFPEWDVGGRPWSEPGLYEKWSPVAAASQFRTPLLLIHGARDYRVPVEQALVMFTAMRRQGVEARLVVFPDEDHFVNKPLNRKFWFETVGGWIREHVKK